ncbi:MAG: AIR synthase-related protein, partial [Pseudomonadota bacterium]
RGPLRCTRMNLTNKKYLGLTALAGGVAAVALVLALSHTEGFKPSPQERPSSAAPAETADTEVLPLQTAIAAIEQPGLRADLDYAQVPVLTAARHLAEQGYVTGASDRNWASLQASVTLPSDAPAWHQKMLTDPQTSGGLLVACEPSAAQAVLEVFARQGFKHAAVIGKLVPGAPAIVVS